MNMNKCFVAVNGESIMQNVGTLYCIDRSVVGIRCGSNLTRRYLFI